MVRLAIRSSSLSQSLAIQTKMWSKNVKTSTTNCKGCDLGLGLNCHHGCLGCSNPRWLWIAGPRQIEPKEMIQWINSLGLVASDPLFEVTLNAGVWGKYVGIAHFYIFVANLLKMRSANFEMWMREHYGAFSSEEKTQKYTYRNK